MAAAAITIGTINHNNKTEAANALGYETAENLKSNVMPQTNSVVLNNLYENSAGNVLGEKFQALHDNNIVLIEGVPGNSECADIAFRSGVEADTLYLNPNTKHSHLIGVFYDAIDQAIAIKEADTEFNANFEVTPHTYRRKGLLIDGPQKTHLALNTIK